MADGGQHDQLLVKSLPEIYEDFVGYALDANPGGPAVEKGLTQSPVQGANNVGTQGGPLDPNCLFCEGGVVSRFANQIPGINAVAGMHDMFQITMGDSLARDVLNVPGMFVAAAITAGGFLGEMMNLVPRPTVVTFARKNANGGTTVELVTLW